MTKVAASLLFIISTASTVIEICDSRAPQQNFQDFRLQKVQQIQELPKLDEDNLGPPHRVQSYAGRRRHRTQAANEKEEEAEAGSDKRRDQKDDPFITVSDEVQTHLSTSNQLQQQRVNKLKAKQQLRSSAVADKVQSADQVDVGRQLALGDSEYSSSAALLQQQHQQSTRKDSEEFLESPSSVAGIHTEASPSGARHRTGKLLAAAATGSGASYARRHQAQAQLGDERDPGADQFSQLYLDTGSMPLEVAAHVGQTANLVCRLRSIHQHQQQQQQQLQLQLQQQQQHSNNQRQQRQDQAGLQVSWRRNLQILTSGLLRFTSDERFQATHVSGSNDWLLEIHNVQPSDEGSYECQVNSEPKPASVSLYLRVMVASIEIIEAQPKTTSKRPHLQEVQVQVEESDQIRLTCRVEFNSASVVGSGGGNLDEAEFSHQASSAHLTELLQDQDRGQRRAAAGTPLTSQHYIFWYKDGVSLEYNNPRGGIKVERRNQAYSMEKVLAIEGASSQTDSGTYMCKIQPELNGIAPALVRVSVGGTNFGSSSSAAAAISRATINLFLPAAIVILQCLLWNG